MRLCNVLSYSAFRSPELRRCAAARCFDSAAIGRCHTRTGRPPCRACGALASSALASSAAAAAAGDADWAARKRVVLVDASNHIYRFHYAFKERLTGPDGTDTTILHNFLKFILEELRGGAGVRGRRLVIVFDSAEALVDATELAPAVRSWRHEAFASYKSGRATCPDEVKSAMRLLPGLLRDVGVQTVSVPGVEADDIIATLAVSFASHGLGVQILTNDKDFKQLLSGQIRLRDRTRELTEDVFEAEYGFEPALFPEFQALRGDPSDNIPGVKGIGEKRAKALVQDYGTLENMFSHVAAMRNGAARRALEAAGLEHALLMRRLVTLDTGVPVPGSKGPGFGAVAAPTPAGVAAFRAACASYGLAAIASAFEAYLKLW